MSHHCYCSAAVAKLLDSRTKNNLNRTHDQSLHNYVIPYSAKFWWDKILANQSFQSFGKENVGKFTIVNISYYSESG